MVAYCWACCAALAQGQPTGKPLFFVESTLHTGAVWRHTPKLSTRTGETLWGQELGLRVQTTGRRSWHAWQRYPSFGATLLHFRLGSGSHGAVWGLVPNLVVPIWRRPAWGLQFRVGTGVGYVTQPYDYFRNPGQNAIGSHWNNIAQFRLSGEIQCSPHVLAEIGASLNHFSNGASSLPNYGINLPAAFASLAWSPQVFRKIDFLPATEKQQAARRWGGALQSGLALVEYSAFDGPKYPIWIASGAVFFQLNRVNRIVAGLEYEFNDAVYTWGLQSTTFREKDAARRGATRLAVLLADEFLFGDIGIQLQAGIYTGKNFNQIVQASWYSKLTTRYYFPALFGTPLRPNIGVSLKAHKAIAEYISLNAGLAF